MEEVLIQEALGTINSRQNLFAKYAQPSTCGANCYCEMCGDMIPAGDLHFARQYSVTEHIIRICKECTGLPVQRALRK